jgi:hypothetical protein
MSFTEVKLALWGKREYFQMQQYLSITMNEDISPSREFITTIKYTIITMWLEGP